MTKTYYVYVHAKPNTTDVYGIFYVGKGNKRRASEVARKANNHHCNIVKKYGKENIIIRKMACASERHAFDLEISIIAILRRMGVELVNLTDGGEGASGWNPPIEFREKISSIVKGRILSKETREKMSAWQIGRKRPEVAKKTREFNTGRKATEETKLKMSKSQTGRKHSEETKYKMSIAQKGLKKKLHLIKRA